MPPETRKTFCCLKGEQRRVSIAFGPVPFAFGVVIFAFPARNVRLRHSSASRSIGVRHGTMQLELRLPQKTRCEKMRVYPGSSGFIRVADARRLARRLLPLRLSRAATIPALRNPADLPPRSPCPIPPIHIFILHPDQRSITTPQNLLTYHTVQIPNPLIRNEI